MNRGIAHGGFAGKRTVDYFIKSMINDIYNTDVLRLAADISRVEALESSDAQVLMRAPLCGSTIQVDLCIEEGRVSRFGQTVKACALGQAAASVLAAQVIGKSADDILAVRDQVEDMLTGTAPAPGGDWSDLSALAPAKDAKSRHGAILLPFDAVLKAFAS